jgi:hypothetical protein
MRSWSAGDLSSLSRATQAHEFTSMRATGARTVHSHSPSENVHCATQGQQGARHSQAVDSGNSSEDSMGKTGAVPGCSFALKGAIEYRVGDTFEFAFAFYPTTSSYFFLNFISFAFLSLLSSL